MAAYVIVNMDVHDAEQFETYRAQVPAIVAKHGGEYLARGGAATVEEGDWIPKRVVLLRFADRASAQAFFDDPEYQPVKEIRFASATSQVVLVDGI